MATETKPKFNIDQLPLIIDGKTELVKRNQYEAYKASTLSLKHKNEIKKSDIHNMIDMIVTGKKLDPEGEDIWVKVHEEVEQDILLAQDKVEEAIEAEKKKDEVAKALENAKIEKATALVTTATTGTNAIKAFADLSDKFDIGSMDRCIPKEGTTVQDALTALFAAGKLEEFSNWAKGDLVKFLEDSGEEQALNILCQQLGIPWKSMFRMAVTSRNVPPEKRNPDVSFTTYAEIANASFSEKKGDEAAKETALKRDELLGKVAPAPAKTGDDAKDAVAKAAVITTSQQAREAVKIAQGKEIAAPADPLAVDVDKHQFIVIKKGDDGEPVVKACIGYPMSLDGDESATIIHQKTGRYINGKIGSKKTKWLHLDTWTEPKLEAVATQTGDVVADPAPAKVAAKKK